MAKLFLYVALVISLGTSSAYAAGGSINGTADQESTIDNSTIVGTPEVGISVGIPNTPLAVGVEVEAATRMNVVDNQGTIGDLTQKNTVRDSFVLGSTVNTITNKDKSNINSVIQKSEIINNSNVLGAEINSINNH